jgi:hypothetical protein
MSQTADTLESDNLRPWQFSLRGLFIFSFTVAVGLSFWKTQKDWSVGALAMASIWVVLGLTAQMRDLRTFGRRWPAANTDELWGRRFAFAWRAAACLLIGVWFVVRLLVGFKIVSPGDSDILIGVSVGEVWDAILLCSIIVAAGGSPDLRRPGWRRPWSWAAGVSIGFVAGFIFLGCLEGYLLVPYLIHVTVTAMSYAQPLCYTMEATTAGTFDRINEFYRIATAGGVSLLASCILLWQLSAIWRKPGLRKKCLGTMLVASLIAMVLLTLRIVAVEIPTISPLLAAQIRMPPPLSLAGGVVLATALAAGVARRWSDLRVGQSPDCAASDRQDTNAVAVGAPDVFHPADSPPPTTWRRNQRRYYHERCILLWPLGCLELLTCIIFWRHMNEICFRLYDAYTVFTFVSNPIENLSFVLALLAVQTASYKLRKRAEANQREQPRLTPAVFLLVWSATLLIIACSVPLLGSWRFAGFLRAGFFAK